MSKFNAWISYPDGSPVPNTDKIYDAPSKRWLARHVAFLNKVEILPGSTIVRLPNGNIVNFQFIH